MKNHLMENCISVCLLDLDDKKELGRCDIKKISFSCSSLSKIGKVDAAVELQPNNHVHKLPVSISENHKHVQCIISIRSDFKFCKLMPTKPEEIIKRAAANVEKWKTIRK